MASLSVPFFVSQKNWILGYFYVMCAVTSAVLQCARETAYFTIIFVEQQCLFEAGLIQSAFFCFLENFKNKTNAFVLISTKSFKVLFFP